MYQPIDWTLSLIKFMGNSNYVLYKLAISLLVFCTCCSDKNDQQTLAPTLVVSTGLIKEDLRLSEIVEDVEFIKIEDTEECLISQIDKIEYFNDKFYLLDRFQRMNVSVFDKNGKFLYYLGTNGEGPNEYSIPYDLHINEKSNEISILTQGKILTFSCLDGTFKESKNLEIPAIRIAKSGENYLFVAGGDEQELVITNDQFEKVAGVFPKNVRNNIKPQESFHSNSEITLYHMTLYDTIYRIENNKAYPHLIIDFGDKGLSNEELLNLPHEAQSNASELKKYLTNYMSYLKVYDETDDFIYFTFLYKDKHHVALNFKETNKTLVFPVDKVINDVTFENYSFYLHTAMSDGYFVGVVEDVASLKDNVDKIDVSTLKEPSYRNKLLKALEKAEYSIANPLLVRVKFKKMKN